MKIEAGKYYRTRDGRKLGPAVIDIPEGRYSWNIPLDGGYLSYNDEGHIVTGDDKWNIVAEWVDTPKLWRDMTPEEKGALLLASYEGKVIQHATTIAATGSVVWNNCQHNWFPTPDLAYRVKPEPTVKEVILHGAGYEWGQSDIACDGDTHRITFNLIDGKPDCASIKMEEL